MKRFVCPAAGRWSVPATAAPNLTLQIQRGAEVLVPSITQKLDRSGLSSAGVPVDVLLEVPQRTPDVLWISEAPVGPRSP